MGVKPTEYRITEEQCRKNISGVCSQCGGELEPIETVDNAHNPTFWCGCSNCGRFDNGVSPLVYTIAKAMVEERHYRAYSHIQDSPSDTEEEKLYHTQCQISGACVTVVDVINFINRHGTVSLQNE